MCRYNAPLILGVSVICLKLTSLSVVLADSEDQKEESNNIRLVGQHDLQGRSAYQPVIQQQGDRWIAYVGHHAGSAHNKLRRKQETNGVSILDVTNPAQPELLSHLPADAGSQMVQTCLGSALPVANDRVYLLRSNGNVSHEVWDVTQPAAPTRVSVPLSGGRHTHKNWWDCKTGIAYMVYDGRQMGWRSHRVLWVVDLSDPARPELIRQYGLPGQQPGSKQAAPPGPHEATLSPDGRRLFIAYGTGSDGVMQIVDVDKLLDCRPDCTNRPSDKDLEKAQIGRLNMPGFWGAHTAWPVIGIDVPEHAHFIGASPRDFVVLVSESFAERCQEDAHDMVFLVDITDATRPFPVANYQVRESSGDFCSRGGQFGAHSVNWSYYTPYYKKVIFVSYFNAGVRAIDIRDPFQPREAGHYIPTATERRPIQTNNVEIDGRGYIYLADRSGHGLHIVELTGPAAKIAPR